MNREQSLAAITSANKDRHVRIYDEGETVFRRMPKGHRLPKGLFPPPSRGPYTVVSQPDKFNLVLKNPSTGELVDNGKCIPLDQILSGPRRARLRFADEGSAGVRSVSQLIEGSRDASGDLTSGHLAGRRTGFQDLSRGAMIAYQTKAKGPGSGMHNKSSAGGCDGRSGRIPSTD